MNTAHIVSLNTNDDLWFCRSASRRFISEAKPYVTRYLIPYELADKDLLLVNTLTGAIDYVRGVTANDLGNLISGRAKNNNAKELRRYLFERGYIYKSKKDEDRVWKMIVEHYSKYDANYDCYIYPTMACNFACPYCFNRKIDISNATMSIEDLKSSLDFIKDHTRKSKIPAKRTNIILFGGEPLLPGLHDNIDFVLKYSKKRKWNVRIITNGYTVKEYLPLIKKYKSQIEYLQITLDGPQKIHDSRRFLKGKDKRGTFRKIAHNIELLAKSRINTVIRVNVDSSNLKTLKDFYRYAGRKKWTTNKYIRFSLCPVLDHSMPTFHTLPMEDHIKLMQEEDSSKGEAPIVAQVMNVLESKTRGVKHSMVYPKTSSCPPARLDAMCFYIDSHIYSCISIVGKKKHAIGRFDKNSGLFKNKSLMWKKRNLLNMKACRQCIMSLYCGGTCPVKGILDKGNINKTICTGAASLEEVLLTYLNMNKADILKKLRAIKKPDISLQL